MSVHHEIYNKLAEKYRLVGDDHFLELMECLMTPEEGLYLLALNTPATPSEVARKLNLDEKTAAEKMDNLARRGLLFRGQTRYVTWMDAHQLKARVMFSAEKYTPQKLLDIRRRDLRHVDSPFAEIHGWFKLFAMTGRQLIRIIPARKAIAANPDIQPGQILWYENIVEMMRRTDRIGVIDCDCRRIYGSCGKPLRNCLHFGKNMVDYETGRGGRMQSITLEEAVAISDEAEIAGLVHNTPGNFAGLTGVMCNCCNDCCATFEPALHSGRINEIVAPSRFRPRVKAELCKGCRQCVKRCPFDAIEMVKVNGPQKLQARIIEEKCLGCGVCVVGCKQKALLFEIVRLPEFIPPAPKIGTPMVYSTL